MVPIGIRRDKDFLRFSCAVLSRMRIGTVRTAFPLWRGVIFLSPITDIDYSWSRSCGRDLNGAHLSLWLNLGRPLFKTITPTLAPKLTATHEITTTHSIISTNSLFRWLDGASPMREQFNGMNYLGSHIGLLSCIEVVISHRPAISE